MPKGVYERNKTKRNKYINLPFILSPRHYSITKWQWKKNGIIFENEQDFIMWYELYIYSDSCWKCNNAFKSSQDRCMDHDHSITDAPNVRTICCQSCNRIIDFPKSKNNKTGETCISYCKKYNKYLFRMTRNKKTIVTKYCKTFDEAVIAKYKFIKENET